MSEHPNVATVNTMTAALFDEDKDTLTEVFAPDLEFHLRGPVEAAGDYVGVGGFLDALGSIMAITGGDIQLDQQFCIGADGWAAVFEHASLGRNGKKLQSKNAFVYRFDQGRIAEMWMYLGAEPERAAEWLA